MFRLVRAVNLVDPGTYIDAKDFCRRAMNKRQRIVSVPLELFNRRARKDGGSVR
jgi:hypothetical protein